MKYKRQKLLFISKILFLTAIFFLILQLIWQYQLEDNKDSLHDIYFIGFILFFLISIIIYLFGGGYLGAGYPNNFHKIKMSLIRWDKTSEINVVQVSKGIWKINNSITFDMKGWFFQTKYIYEYINLSLIVYKFNKTNDSYISLLRKRKHNKDIIIRFVYKNGMIEEKYLVKNHVIKKTFGIIKRIVFSAESSGQGLKTRELLKNKELSINQFFN